MNENTVSERVDFGDYFENLQSWHEHKNDNNVLFLTYENMKADIIKAIIAIASFIGYGEKIKEQTILDKIVLNSSFESMSQNQQRWSSKRPDHMPPFIRKGKVGDWKNHFSAKQQQRLQEKINNYSSIKALWSTDIFGESLK